MEYPRLFNDAATSESPKTTMGIAANYGVISSREYPQPKVLTKPMASSTSNARRSISPARAMRTARRSMSPARATPIFTGHISAQSDARSIRDSAVLQVAPIPDDEYFHVENVYVQVSDRLFAIPKEHLDIPGSTFHDMFCDISYNNPAQTSTGLKIARGSHSTHPIILTAVTVEEFRSFLKVAWPRKNSLHPLHDQGWKDVLTLAAGWKFDEIMNKAKERVFQILQSKDQAFELITLGRQFGFSHWVVHGYTLLARPSHMLSGKLLLTKGLGDKMSDIFMIREALRQLESGKSLPCMGCNNAPPCTPYIGKPCKCPLVAYCTCRQTIFLHPSYPPGTNFDWIAAANTLVQEVFQSELAAFDRLI